MIQINQITKRYGENKGVFDLTFSVPKGEVFGYLGPNGAGKTTTIRHLLGFLNPDSGSCSVNGLDCRKQAAEIQRFTGYIAGEIAFLNNMTGIEFLKLLANMRGMKSNKKRDELLELLELDPRGNIRKMSKGMKQKLGIVTAFMHDPDVLILDEPSSGLDPLMQNRFVELIHSEKAAGKTILMSSHSFEEVERSCDSIGIIRLGRLAAVESIAALQAAQRKVYAVTFADATEAQRFGETDFEILSVSGSKVEVVIFSNLTAFLSALPDFQVIALDTVQQSLEDVFMQYFGKEGAV
ncbi:MAG TPA: ATP-binding cassette domain-containing protein [Levilinea sp.]|nr:ATP-binding cassette domain-containing protein [Levilinea sp.]